jgi:hypothetical protein
MMATSLQQWARRYLQNTQPAVRSLQERARLRAFFVNGIIEFRVPQSVEVLPALVHLSLFIFFAGLLIYLFNIHRTVFNAVICWVALLLVGYACITFMPICWPDSPYYSPLSPLAWFLYTRILYIVLKLIYGLLSRFCAFDFRHRILEWFVLFRQRKRRGIQWEVKQAISKQSAEIDLRILRWTVRVLREDEEQEKVFESIPGFFQSNRVKLLRDRAQSMTEDAMGHFLRSTLSSNLVPKSVKIRRLTTCLNAAIEVLPPAIPNMFGELIYVDWRAGLDSVDIGRTLRSWDEASDGRFTPYIRGIIAAIVSSVRERKEPWAALTRDHLGALDGVPQDYPSHGDSVLLANFIHFTRHANRSEFFALDVVRLLSRFNARNTLPELQHDFCALWNEIIREAQKGDAYSYPVLILREIHHHYIALHQAADVATPPPCCDSSIGIGDFDFSGPLYHPLSYPLCTVPGHRSHPINHNHNYEVATVIAEAAGPPVTTFVTPSSSPPSLPVHPLASPK